MEQCGCHDLVINAFDSYAQGHGFNFHSNPATGFDPQPLNFTPAPNQISWNWHCNPLANLMVGFHFITLNNSRSKRTPNPLLISRKTDIFGGPHYCVTSIVDRCVTSKRHGNVRYEVTSSCKVWSWPELPTWEFKSVIRAPLVYHCIRLLDVRNFQCTLFWHWPVKL